MGNVACGIGTEGSRSCFDGAATCGLPVKRAVPFRLISYTQQRFDFCSEAGGREGESDAL
jgi:hypothetical protein